MQSPSVSTSAVVRATARARSSPAWSGRAPSEGKRFVVVESASDEHYTRNLRDGAPIADVSVVVVDARHGLTAATRRHGFFASLLAVRHVVLAVNKMDLVDDAQAAFARIDDDWRRLAAQLGLPNVTCVPISAENGDNVRERSGAMPWYAGPTLAELLDRVEPEQTRLREQPLRLPIRTVNRAEPGGLEGTIVAGRLRTGDAVRVQPSGQLSRVSRMPAPPAISRRRRRDRRSRSRSTAGRSTCRRGDLIVAADAPAEIANQFEATVVWLTDAPLLRGPQLRAAHRRAAGDGDDQPAQVQDQPEHAGPDRRDHARAQGDRRLQPAARSRACRSIPTRTNRDTGGFVLVDKLTGRHRRASACCTSRCAAPRTSTGRRMDVNKAARAAIKGQKPCVLWYTGLSGRGQVDDRQPGRQAPARRGPPHLPAGRRQRPPRAEPRPRLHRRRSRREHPPHRRGGEADGRRGADRQHRLHLAVPRRTSDGARAGRRRGVHRDLRRHAAGRRRAARSEGALQEGPARRSQELHRHRFALRASRDAGADDRHDRGHARGCGGDGGGLPASDAAFVRMGDD